MFIIRNRHTLLVSRDGLLDQSCRTGIFWRDHHPHRSKRTFSSFSDPHALLADFKKHLPTYDPNFVKDFQVVKHLHTLRDFCDDPKDWSKFRKTPAGKKFVEDWREWYNGRIADLGEQSSLDRPTTRRLDKD